MAHFTIKDLETCLNLAACSPDIFTKDADGSAFCYVEVGRYKPYMMATVKAAEKRGYRVVQKIRGSVYYVYPKGV